MAQSDLRFPTDEELPFDPIRQVFTPNRVVTQPQPTLRFPTEEELPFLPKEEGVWAHLKKGFADMADYVTISVQGVGDPNEEVIAESIADVTRRSQEIARSEGHQYLLDLFQREGKDIDEAEGFVNTSKEILDLVGKGVWAAITEPQGMAEFTAGQLGMQAPGLAGLFLGFVSPMPGGALVGMGAGEMAVETGAAVIEALHKRGIDASDSDAVKKALYDSDLLGELYKEGVIKAGTIAAFGMASVGTSKFMLGLPGRKLAKELIDSGVTKPLNKGGMAEALSKEIAGDKSVKTALKNFADATTKGKRVKRAVAAGGVELLTEGGGEGFGQKFAWGEVEAAEVGLEMLGAGGQTVIQTAITNAFTGAKDLNNRYLLKRHQRNALEKGESSRIEPAKINEALQAQIDEVKARMVDIDSEMTLWETVLAEADSNDSLNTMLDQVLTLEGVEQYQSILQDTLSEVVKGDTIPIWAALTEVEQATLSEGKNIGRAIRGSINKESVKAKSTETVTPIRVPIASVMARGNWDAGELVALPDGVELVVAPPVEETKEGAEETAPPLTEAELAEREATLTQEDLDLDTEVGRGELEEEAKIRSEKDVSADVNNVVVRNQNKLRQFKEASEYESKELPSVVERLKLTPRGKTVSARREVITSYRKALDNPDSVSAVNKALENTGYKVSVSKGVVRIIPIDPKDTRYKPLRNPETGSRRVGQDSIDSYLTWIREGQTTETKRPAIRKSPLKGRTIITPQSAGPLTSLQTVFKRKGKGQFVERVRKLLSNKKGNDAILEQIAKVYRKAKPGRVEGDAASILTLAGKSDQADIARAYALANMLITLRDSVTSILPDDTLSIDVKGTEVLARLEFRTPMGGVRENQLINQIRETFGDDATYTRISDFEVVIGSPSLKPLQLARRFGRLKVKRNDIRSSGLFTAKTETYTHNWSEDPTGESIREQIRSLGFGDLLAWADNRRADYLGIAEEIGAKEVEQYRVAPRAPPEPAPAPAPEAAAKKKTAKKKAAAKKKTAAKKKAAAKKKTAAK